MSLDWSTVDVDPDLKAKHFPPDAQGKMANELHSLIFSTMSVGISKITAANAHDFWVRLDLWQLAIGPMFNVSVDDEWKPLLVTKEQVFAAIGLGTNASPKTKSQFLKDLYAAKARA